MTVGEIWNDSRTASEYVDNGEMDLTFNFELSDDIISGVTFRDANRVSRSLVLQEREFDPGWYAAFLTNHDMTRLMTKIGGEWSRAKAAATVLLTSPGVPFIYYGEEIGMTGDKPDELLRTPMQWTAGEQAGFTSGTPWARVNLDYTQKNVEDEAADPDSLLNHYRQLIRIRNDHYALRSGDLIEVKTGERSLLAILRVAEKEAVLVLINLSDDPIENVSLSWEASSLSGSLKPVILLGDGQVPTLAVNAAGGVEGFQALPEMDANQNLIVQFVR
jgi:glycosidase